MNVLSRVAALLAAAITLAGCATFNMIKAPPAQQEPVSVTWSGAGPSGWSDLPIGVYRVPATNVIISGHQGNGAGIAGVLFGVVGIIAADAIETSAGAKKVKNAEDVLHIDLVPEAGTLTQTMLASGRFGGTFSTAAAVDGPVLEVDPYTVITFANDTDARPSVILKATLKPKSAAKPAWTARYIAVSEKALPLIGENSLTANDGALLKTALHRDLERAVGAVLDDVANRHPRDGSKPVYVETAIPFVKQRMAMTGDTVAQDGQTLVLAPKIGDAVVFSGVYVLDTSEAITRPATKDDKLKMLDEEKVSAAHSCAGRKRDGVEKAAAPVVAERPAPGR